LQLNARAGDHLKARLHRLHVVNTRNQKGQGITAGTVRLDAARYIGRGIRDGDGGSDYDRTARIRYRASDLTKVLREYRQAETRQQARGSCRLENGALHSSPIGNEVRIGPSRVP